jgi:stage III sporulation protein SpoIIIAA
MTISVQIQEVINYMKKLGKKSMSKQEVISVFPSMKAILGSVSDVKYDQLVRKHTKSQLIYAFEIQVFYLVDMSSKKKKVQEYRKAVDLVIQHMRSKQVATLDASHTVQLCPWITNLWHMSTFWSSHSPPKTLSLNSQSKILTLKKLSSTAPTPPTASMLSTSSSSKSHKESKVQEYTPIRYKVIDTNEGIETLAHEIDSSPLFNFLYTAVDVEYVDFNAQTSSQTFDSSHSTLPALALIQIAFAVQNFESDSDSIVDTETSTPSIKYFAYIIDYMQLKNIDTMTEMGDEAKSALGILQNVFQLLNDRTTWVAHDARMEVLLLRESLQVELNSVVDTQLVLEEISGESFKGLNSFLALANMQHWSKTVIHREMDKGTDLFRTRPLSKKVLQYAADDVLLLLEACEKIMKNTNNNCDFKVRQVAHSKLNLKYLDASQWPLVPRTMCFDGSDNYKLRSAGLVDPTKRANMETLSTSMAIEQFQNILPPNLMEWILKEDLTDARDLVLDVGRVPRLFFRNHSKQVDESVELTLQDLESICEKLHFGKDNRAILEASLHRISAMRNLDGEIYSLTIRFGRTITGASSIFQDILHGPLNHSVLILGSPGTGKSSLMRDMIRSVSLQGNHTIVVDTSNELCGSGNIVHSCVGLARRMMVPDLESQKRVMIEAVQNHTPDVLVIDEIGRSQEVHAAATIKRRGVRLLATAHGSFCELMKNPDLVDF